jgi:hypothetical protein
MSSIIRTGDTYHGISLDGRGVFKATIGRTYAGQCKGGYACGLGVATLSNGTKYYAEHGPDGQHVGRYLYRTDDGGTGYRLYERCKLKAHAVVYADGTCWYNGNACAPDDPRFLAMIAQVAPVEVRRAAPAPQPATRTPSNRPMDKPARFAPQALAKATATEVHAHAARRR